MAFTTDFSGSYEDDLQRYGENVLKRTEDVANIEYTPYGGERVLGYSPEEEEARSRMKALTESGLGYDQMGQASEIMSELGRYEAGTYDPSLVSGADIMSYMNPFIRGAIDPTLRELEEMKTTELQQMGAQASAAGAFGGSRHGIAEGVTRRGYGQTAGDILATGMAKGYTEAVDLAQSDLDRINQGQIIEEAMRQEAAGIRGSAASGLSQVANQLREAGYSDAEISMALEKEDRALRQAQGEEKYQEFLREQAYPSQQLGIALSPLTGTSGVAQVAPTYEDPSFIQNLLGGGAYASEILKNIGQSGIEFNDITKTGRKLYDLADKYLF